MYISAYYNLLVNIYKEDKYKHAHIRSHIMLFEFNIYIYIYYMHLYIYIHIYIFEVMYKKQKKYQKEVQEYHLHLHFLSVQLLQVNRQIYTTMYISLCMYKDVKSMYIRNTTSCGIPGCMTRSRSRSRTTSTSPYSSR